MKNDLKKIDKVTFEMKMNDIVYKFVQTEYDKLIYDIQENVCDDMDDAFERLYFYKRFMSVFANYDIPVKASIGLFGNIGNLYEDAYDYIGDSDTDNDIYRYAIEYGYRKYDDIALVTDTPEDVLDRIVVEAFKHYAERGEKCDE